MELENLEYRILKEPNDDIRNLLSQTVYGTKGGLRLMHCDTSWKLDELISPDYHVLYNKSELVGVVVYGNRRAYFGEVMMNSLYIRYFSIAPKYQNQGVAQYLTQVAVSNYRTTLQEPTVVYAFIEAKNFRSQAVSKHFEPLSLGYFSPIYFSRFFPKLLMEVNTDKASFMELYPMDFQVNFRYEGRSDRKAEYYTIKKHNQFATIRFYRVNWEVLDYPNNNWLMKKILPRIPLVNRLVEGEKLTFLAVDAVAWNSDELLLELFEHALAQSSVYKLFVFADLKDVRFDGLRQHKNLGLMSKLQKSPRIGIQLFFHECPDETKEMIQSMPVEIRGFDVT